MELQKVVVVWNLKYIRTTPSPKKKKSKTITTSKQIFCRTTVKIRKFGGQLSTKSGYKILIRNNLHPNHGISSLNWKGFWNLNSLQECFCLVGSALIMVQLLMSFVMQSWAMLVKVVPFVIVVMNLLNMPFSISIMLMQLGFNLL